MEGTQRRRKRERRRSDMEMLNIVDLPFFVAVDILSRLPVAALIRCRCVCKTWRNLISDPYFAHTQLARSATVDVVVSKNETNFYCLELIADYDYTTRARKSSRFLTPMKLPGQTPILVGSSNGLLCLWDNSSIDSLFICNPILGEYVALPKPTSGEQVKEGFSYMFGYSRTTQQYKVLRFFSEQLSYHRQLRNTNLRVHTVGTNGWRDLGEISLHFFGRGVNLNGALHRLALKDTIFIYSFELEEERVIPIPFPSTLSNISHCPSFKLGMLGNCLCLFHHKRHNLDIWSMKDYGVPYSWTKDCSLTISIPKPIQLYPVTVWKDGEILMTAENFFKPRHLVSYNPKIKTFTIPRIYNMKSTPIIAVTFVPSFLSLKDVAVTKSLKIQNVGSK